LPTTIRGEHVYVYAAIEGTPGALPAETMPGAEAPRLVEISQGVSLVVSTVPSSLYNAASLDSRLADLDWVSAAGAAHHVVIDALADAGLAVLPFRLFAIFSSEEQAILTVRRRLPALERAFDRVRGRQEWVLRVAKPDSPRMEQTETRAAAQSGTSFLAAKAVARQQEAARAERVKQGAAASYEALRSLADDATVRPVEPGGNLILDAALLLQPSRVHALKEALTTAAAGLLRDVCHVSLTGPWPPYSFASVDTKVDA
jgi:hypothetical protein